MKTATKRLSAWLFVLLGMTPLLFVIFSGIKQQQVQNAMKRQLETGMLHSIVLAKNEVIWLKEGKEILVNGRMFDIRSFSEAATDQIIFTGLFDDDETALVNMLKTNQQTENSRGGKILAQLFQLLQASFNHPLCDPVLTTFHPDLFPGPEKHLPVQFLPVFSPPPQI